MPKIKKGRLYEKTYSENDVQNALEEISKGMPIKRASIQFNIPRATLQFRRSQKFKKTNHGPPPVLFNEEKILVEWVLDNYKKGFPRRQEDVCAAVKDFLTETPRQNPFKDNYPGWGWYRAFLKRHPELSARTAEAVTQASSRVSENDIRNWFIQINTYVSNNNLGDILNDPKRIYNGDETNFQLCPKNSKVLAPKGAKNVYEVDVGQSKQTITVMFTFAASGDLTPPMIIYPFKRMPQHILNTVPKNWGAGHSDNGWMKAELFYEYIANVLYPHLKENNVIFPILLFVDGHTTHLTYKLSQLCNKLQIVLICLYPNATRVLQPADVAAFKPLKTGWKKGVLEWRRENPTAALTKEKFAPVLEKVIQNSVKSDTIVNGFRSCGLFPWNENAIDYSKCIGKKNDKKKDCKNDFHTQVSSALGYENFENIVGTETIENLKKIDTYLNNYNEDFIKLYHVWKAFFTNNAIENENDIDNCNINETRSELTVVKDSEIDKSNEANTRYDIELITAMKNKDETLIDIDTLPITILSDDGEIIHKTDDLFKSTQNFNDLLNEKENTPVQENVGVMNKEVSFKEILTWPVTPQKKRKINIREISVCININRLAGYV